MIRTKICCGCGKVFSFEVAKGTDRKYCSDKCRYDAYNKKLKLRNDLSKKKITRTCICGKVFSYYPGRGRYKKYCSEKCSQDNARKRQKEAVPLLPKCSTPFCEGKANRKGSGLCEACYMRLRRRGTTDYKQYPYRQKQSAGYLWVREPNHPLADQRGLVYEHRFVFYECFGSGPFKCYWCGSMLRWENMNIDHLDEDKANNDISNLVASCPVCNRARGRAKLVAKNRARGNRITYNGKTKCVAEWAREIGIAHSTFMRRLDLWELEDVMTRAPGNSGPKRMSSVEI